METTEIKSPSASEVITTQIVLPGGTNALGTAFGGTIFGWIDVAAAVAAQRHSGGEVVTASIDTLNFLAPVQLGDVVILRARVNRSWRSSMEIGVRVECETVGKPGDRLHAATAYLTFVAVDENGKPRPVAQIVPETEGDERRYEKAARRRQARLEQRQS